MKKHISQLLALSVLMLAFCQCITEPTTPPSNPGSDSTQPGGNGGGNGGNGGDNGGGSSTWLDLTPSSLTLSHESQEKLVYLLTNAADGWHTEGSTVDWIDCTINADHLRLRIAENTTDEARSTEIVVTAADLTKSIMILQNCKDGGNFELIQGEGYSYVLDDNTIILPSEYIKYLQNVDLSRQVFHVPAEIADKVTIIAGTKVVINTPTAEFPNGLLARIQEVTPDADGGYNVSYSTAPVLDCFRDFDIDECDVDLYGHVQKVLDKDGNELDFHATKSIATEKLHLVIPQVDIDLPMGLSITPKMEADITMKTQLKAENYSLSTLNIIMDADCTLGADISADCDYTSMSWQPHQKVISIVFGAIPVGPLLITPTMDIYTIAMIEMKLKMEASVSYKRSFRAHVHYDEVTGLDMTTKLYDEEPDALKLDIGPKLEAGVKYGLGIGPGISLYGGALGVGVSLNSCINESVSAKFNLMDPNLLVSTRKGSAFPLWSLNPTYDYGYELSASASLYGVGFGFSATSPEIKFPVMSCPVAPKLSEDIDIASSGDEVTITAKVEGGQSLFYGPLIALLYNSDDPNNTSDYITAEFDFDREKYELMEEQDEVEVVARTPIDPGKRYNLDIFTDIEGVTCLLRSYYPEIRGMDKKFCAAVRAILRDIRSSAVGEWEGCNWDNAYVSVGDYENVSIGYNYSTGIPGFRITIPEEWELSSNLKIGNHTEGIEDIMDSWSLSIYGDDRHFSKVEINDPSIWRVDITNHIDSYAIHSELISVSWIPGDAQEVDYSGCIGISKDFRIYMSYNPKLKKFVCDRTPMEKLTIFGVENKNGAMPEVVLGTTSLENLNIYDLDISGKDFTKMEHVKKLTFGSCKGLLNARCYAEELHLGGIHEGVTISDCPNLKFIEGYYVHTPSVVISNNPLLTEVELYMRSSENIAKEYIGALSITDCPSVTKIACWDTGMTSLVLSGLPSLSYLNCSSNYSLTGIMLPIFDELFARKATLSYDQRYTDYCWEYDSYTCNDKGYGFYYEGEPERGYHRK